MKKDNKKAIYNLTTDEVLKRFDTSFLGISDVEAERRMKESGKNQIEKKRDWKFLKLFVNQFNDALVWILLVAAALAGIFGEYRDVSIILAIVAINSAVGFFQEFKAERILDSIRRLTTDKARILRDGAEKEIDSHLLVSGDVVKVSAGDRIPADGYILESFDLRVSSFIFTGESRPESKQVGLMENHPVLADITNMLFSGETVATGEASFVVTATGMETELGKIAGLTQEVADEPTPMQKQMRVLGRNVSILAAIIGTLVMVVGQYFQMSLYENFLFALALAVSVVPEGLPAAISVALSLGMKRLLKENVLAKKLNAVETLGSVSVICTDKTGTITRNELTVVKVVVDDEVLDVSGVGYAPEGKFYRNGSEIDPKSLTDLEMLFRIGTLCNDAALVKDGLSYRIIGDPTEGAIIVAGQKYDSDEKHFFQGERKITVNPFSSERMMMSAVFQNSETISFVKGSPDIILERCDRKKIGGMVSEFSEAEKARVRETYNLLSREALRVLAFAYRELEADVEDDIKKAENGLIWVGMMAMIDPPRQDVQNAISECRQLGIKIIMITGDYELTAEAIAKKIGLVADGAGYEIINGKKLDDLKDAEIYKKIKERDVVFARIAPEQKLRIATILKNNQQVIAMTGDGVNDAPALKKADIGVAMGIMGTDVSKEAADMVLVDDNFSSIVKGVREGRTIFQNLKKFVHYVLTSNASELMTVVFGVLLQIPAPITAIQILSIDLATDVFPSFALGLEPTEPTKGRGGVRSEGGIMNLQGFRRIIYLGVIMAAGAVVAFIWSMLRGGWKFGQVIDVDAILYIKSTTAVYAVLAMSQMANLLQARSERLTPTELGFFKNPYVIGSIFISFGILLSFMYLPFFQKYLQMAPIDWQDWLMVGLTFVAVYFFEEARKTEKRNKL